MSEFPSHSGLFKCYRVGLTVGALSDHTHKAEQGGGAPPISTKPMNSNSFQYTNAHTRTHVYVHLYSSSASHSGNFSRHKNHQFNRTSTVPNNNCVTQCNVCVKCTHLFPRSHLTMDFCSIIESHQTKGVTESGTKGKCSLPQKHTSALLWQYV